MAHKARAKKIANVKDDHATARFSQFAEHVVAPGLGKAMIAPSLCPSRAGAVNYPLVVEVSGMSDFCVIAQPDISAPLRITHPTGVAESSDAIGGTLDKDYVGEQCLVSVTRGCEIEAVELGSYPAVPFYSAAGCTLQPKIALTEGDDIFYNIDFWYYDGVWTLGSTLPSFGVGFGEGTLPNVVYPATATGWGFRMRPTNSLTVNGGTAPSTCHGSFRLNVVAGTATCSTGSSQNVFDVYVPSWDKVLEVADKISIPYMDLLVTYQGSTLNNQGAIATCATSEELLPPDGDYYAAIASRPFDMYEGRLASNGESEGGAHWHLLHDDIRAYSLSRSEELITGPRGYVAIKGMDPTQPVRIIMHLTLNYYTLDPSFSMSFQPPWGELDLLLHTMRTQVPLVSSNDSHLDKVLKLGKRQAAKAAKWALKNPEEAVALAMSAAEFIGPLLV